MVGLNAERIPKTDWSEITGITILYEYLYNKKPKYQNPSSVPLLEFSFLFTPHYLMSLTHVVISDNMHDLGITH